ncbi:MAG: hypothetical protein WBZ37_21640 [Mycobacterium sp.]
MKCTATDVAAMTIVDLESHRAAPLLTLPLTSAPHRTPTAGMPPVWVVGAEPEQ